MKTTHLQPVCQTSPTVFPPGASVVQLSLTHPFSPRHRVSQSTVRSLSSTVSADHQRSGGVSPVIENETMMRMKKEEEKTEETGKEEEIRSVEYPEVHDLNCSGKDKNRMTEEEIASQMKEDSLEPPASAGKRKESSQKEETSKEVKDNTEQKSDRSYSSSSGGNININHSISTIKGGTRCLPQTSSFHEGGMLHHQPLSFPLPPRMCSIREKSYPVCATSSILPPMAVGKLLPPNLRPPANAAAAGAGTGFLSPALVGSPFFHPAPRAPQLHSPTNPIMARLGTSHTNAIGLPSYMIPTESTCSVHLSTTVVPNANVRENNMMAENLAKQLAAEGSLSPNIIAADVSPNYTDEQYSFVGQDRRSTFCSSMLEDAPHPFQEMPRYSVASPFIMSSPNAFTHSTTPPLAAIPGARPSTSSSPAAAAAVELFNRKNGSLSFHPSFPSVAASKYPPPPPFPAAVVVPTRVEEKHSLQSSLRHSSVPSNMFPYPSVPMSSYANSPFTSSAQLSYRHSQPQRPDPTTASSPMVMHQPRGRFVSGHPPGLPISTSWWKPSSSSSSSSTPMIASPPLRSSLKSIKSGATLEDPAFQQEVFDTSGGFFNGLPPRYPQDQQLQQQQEDNVSSEELILATAEGGNKQLLSSSNTWKQRGNYAGDAAEGLRSKARGKAVGRVNSRRLHESTFTSITNGAADGESLHAKEEKKLINSMEGRHRKQEKEDGEIRSKQTGDTCDRLKLRGLLVKQGEKIRHLEAQMTQMRASARQAQKESGNLKTTKGEGGGRSGGEGEGGKEASSFFSRQSQQRISGSPRGERGKNSAASRRHNSTISSISSASSVASAAQNGGSTKAKSAATKGGRKGSSARQANTSVLRSSLCVRSSLVQPGSPLQPYVMQKAMDSIDEKLQEWHNSHNSMLGWRRVNRGLYYFGETEVHLDVINGKLMACVEDVSSWNHGKMSVIDQFVAHFEPIERTRLKEINLENDGEYH